MRKSYSVTGSLQRPIGLSGYLRIYCPTRPIMDTYVILQKTNYDFLIGLHTELVGNMEEKPQEWVWGIHIRGWQNMLWYIQRQPL